MKLRGHKTVFATSTTRMRVIPKPSRSPTSQLMKEGRVEQTVLRNKKGVVGHCEGLLGMLADMCTYSDRLALSAVTRQ